MDGLKKLSNWIHVTWEPSSVKHYGLKRPAPNKLLKSFRKLLKNILNLISYGQSTEIILWNMTTTKKPYNAMREQSNSIPSASVQDNPWEIFTERIITQPNLLVNIWRYLTQSLQLLDLQLNGCLLLSTQKLHIRAELLSERSRVGPQ